ncbi:MAG: glycosyltransferase family 4 protein [Planctomycetota bacterium]
MHVVHQFPPEFRGGTEACVETLGAAQLARGDEVTVIAGSDQRNEKGEITNETVEGLTVRRVLRRPGENYSMDHRNDRVADAVCALVEGLAPDVVHLHHTLNLSGDLGARLAAGGHAVVATLHDFTLVCARFFLVRPDGESCAEAWPLPSERCVDCVLPDFPAGREELTVEAIARRDNSRSETEAYARAIAPSKIVRDRWLASGLLGEDKLVLLPHGVATPEAATDGPAARPRDRSDGRLVLATWGHLAPDKGLLDLLAAMHRIGDRRLALHVLGEPVDAAYAGKLLDAAEGLDVIFRGAYGPSELAGLRAHADLAVFPSRAEETFGLVVAEALALGFPTLVSDRGALPERVGRGTPTLAGAVVPAANPIALATALQHLLVDDEPMERWAAAARGLLLSPSEHAERVAGLYAEVLEAAGP